MGIVTAACILLLCLPGLLGAQTIRGRVIDESSGEAVRGAVVEARPAGGQTIASIQADSTGRFALEIRDPGRYQITARHPSFTAPAAFTVALGRSETLEVELRLTRTALPLRPLIITSERDPRLVGFRERMNQPGSGQFLTRAEIDVRPGARTTDLLREFHGLEIVPTGGTLSRPRVNILRMRSGVGVCSPAIYIDGIYVRQMPDSGIDDFLKPEMLEGAEIYTSATSAPPSLDARGACGVVAFWTRSVGETERMNWRRLVMLGGALAALLLVVLLSR